MNITYKNKLGEVVFGGGGMESAWRITALSGLGLAEKNVTVSSYIGQAGNIVTSSFVGGRAITITCDLKAGYDIQRVLSRTLTILDTNGEMVINIGFAVKKIKCRLAAVSEGERDCVFRRYVFQFAADFPYFEDLEKTYIGVYAVENLVDSDFTLPGILSKRISRQTINYAGAAAAEPVFVINAVKVAQGESNSGVYIKNHTTGQVIKLNYQAHENEEITIDVPNRKIYNSEGTDLISKISDDTFLDGFLLLPGENDIEAVNSGVNTTLTVICEYSNLYREAEF